MLIKKLQFFKHKIHSFKYKDPKYHTWHYRGGATSWWEVRMRKNRWNRNELFRYRISWSVRFLIPYFYKIWIFVFAGLGSKNFDFSLAWNRNLKRHDIKQKSLIWILYLPTPIRPFLLLSTSAMLSKHPWSQVISQVHIVRN